MEDLVVNFSNDILVKVRQGHEVAVSLTHQGVQGPPGPVGDITPQLAAARDAAVAAKTAAQGSETSALAAKTAAQTARTGAETAQTAAQAARTGAETAQTAAQTAQIAAETSRSAASNARGLAEVARDAAISAKIDAEAARNTSHDWAALAETERGLAVDARIRAEAARDTAQQYKIAAGDFAAASDTRADDAEAHKIAAAQSLSDITAAILALGLPSAHTASNFLRRNSANTGFEYRTPSDVLADIAAEPARTLVTEQIAETGSDTTVSGWSSLRVRQAVAAYAAQVIHTHDVSDVEGLAEILANLSPLVSPHFTGAPTAPTPDKLDDSTKIATTAFVKLIVNDVIAAAPGALDTLNELAAALGDDPNFATTITNALAEKAALDHVHVMADISDLAAALNLLATKASPALSGNPTAPTQELGNDSTRIANTAFVKAALDALRAVLAEKNHGHTIDQIGDLQSILDGKWDAATLPATELGKSILNAATAAAVREILGGSANLSTISQVEAQNGTATATRMWTSERVRQNVVAYAAQIIHTHAIADIVGLQEVLDGKVDKGMLSGGADIVHVGSGNITAASNGTIVVMRSATAATLTLAAPATLGSGFMVFVTNTGLGDLTVVGSFDNGETEVKLEQGQSMALTCNGETHRLLLRGGGAGGGGSVIPIVEDGMGDGTGLINLVNTPASKDAMTLYVGGVPQRKSKFALAGNVITLTGGATIAADEQWMVTLLKGGASVVGVDDISGTRMGDGGAVYQLPVTPVTNSSLTVSIEGLEQPKDGTAYTFVGTTLTFTESISSNMQWGFQIKQPVGINVPNPETVGAAELKTSDKAAIQIKLDINAAETIGATQINGSDATAIRNKLGTGNADNLTSGMVAYERIGSALPADKAFRRGNILGPVSQSGGVPTGAVIERGSNANGEYVKFADGTMICTKTDFVIGAITTLAAAPIYITSPATWTFPSSFITGPVVQGNDASSIHIWLVVGTAGATNCMLTGFCYSSIASSRTVKLTAVGRWF